MFAGVLCLACLGTATPVRADASALPGGPSSRTGVFAIGPETGLVIPASTKRLCPAGTQCIADLGWSVGVAFSYRWAKGIGLGVAYEFWLMTANGVYEVTVPQMFLGTLRYSFLPSRSTHPVIRLRASGRSAPDWR